MYWLYWFIYALHHLEGANGQEKNCSCAIVSCTLQELLRLKSQGFAFQEFIACNVYLNSCLEQLQSFWIVSEALEV